MSDTEIPDDRFPLQSQSGDWAPADAPTAEHTEPPAGVAHITGYDVQWKANHAKWGTVVAEDIDGAKVLVEVRGDRVWCDPDDLEDRPADAG